MKKTFYIFAATLLLLTACSSSKWTVDKNLTPEIIAGYEATIEEQLAILEETPDDEKALFEVAFRYQNLGQYKKAVKYYEKVLEVDSSDYATLNNLATIYEDVEEYEKAAEYIKQLYEIDQTSIEVIKDTVRILLKAGDALNAEHAVQNFESQVTDPANPNPDMDALIDELYNDIYTWVEENSVK